MKKQLSIFRLIILFMAFVVMAAHIVPSSIQLLDPEFCVSMNMTDSELEEEEKELVQIVATKDLLGTIQAQTYADHFEDFPSAPCMETLIPPPDFI
jgi:hypothetical protein